MKQIVFSQLFYPELISTGLTLTELCESLSKKGVSIEVYCGPPTLVNHQEQVPKHLKHKNITIHRLWTTQFPKTHLLGKAINHISFIMSAFFKLISLPTSSPILVLTNPPLLPLLFALLRPFKRFKYHVLLFDLYPETLVSQSLFSATNPIVKLWSAANQSVYKYATSLITIGRCMHHHVLSTLPSNHHPKLHYVPIWCDDDAIRHPESSRNFRKEWELEHKFIVAYTGNLARFHDIETIMSAINHLKPHSDIHFLFVGEGHKKPWAQSYAADNDCHNCHFHSYVAREDFPALLHTIDAGIVCLDPAQVGLSVPSKTMGLLAAGCPILGVLPEECEISYIIKDHDCGLLSAPGDATQLANHILQLKNNQAQLAQFKTNASHASSTTYNLDQSSSKIREILS